MKQIKDLFVNIGVSCVLLFAAVTCFGQGTIEPSYEVSVQLVMGSNATGFIGRNYFNRRHSLNLFE